MKLEPGLNVVIQVNTIDDFSKFMNPPVEDTEEGEERNNEDDV